MFRWAPCFVVLNQILVLAVGLGMLGPVDLIFKAVEECNDPKHVVELTVDQYKYNRSVVVMDITVNTPYDIDSELTLELLGSIKKDGGYKPGSFYLKDHACKCLETILGNMFVDMLKAAGREDGCPLPAGEHFAHNFYFDNSKFTVPSIYGEYKMEALLFKDNELQTCYNIYYDFVPKAN